MSSRWRERKATLASSAELQARRKALLAPVQRYRRGWVQLRADSAYKVLKWVPQNMIPGTTSSIGHLESFFEETDEIDASTDEEEEEEEEEGDEREGEGSEINVVGSGRGRSTGEAEENNEPSNTRSHKGLKMERKTSKAVEDTERVGGQLAGLEIGQIPEQTEIEDEDDEEEELVEQATAEQDPQTTQAAPMDEDEEDEGHEHQAIVGTYSHPPPEPPSTTSSILPPADQPPSSTNDISMTGNIPGLRFVADLSQPSYVPSTDHPQPSLGAIANSSSQSIPSIVHPVQASEMTLETDQGLPPEPLSHPPGDRPNVNHPTEQQSVQDPDHLDHQPDSGPSPTTLNISNQQEEPCPDVSMA